MDLILADVHVPDEVDEAAWLVALDAIRKLRPDRVILLGDFAECSSFSRHIPPAAMPSTADEERKGIRRYLAELRRWHPKGEIVWFEGNHEEMPRKWCDAHAPQLALSFDIPVWAGLSDFDTKWVPVSMQPIELAPNLLAAHGHQLFAGLPPKQHARKVIDHADCDWVYGHTHRPDVATKELLMARGHRFVRATGLGCLRTLKPSWNGGKARASGWSHELGVVEYDESGRGTVHAIPITAGRAAYGGQQLRGIRALAGKRR